MSGGQGNRKAEFVMTTSPDEWDGNMALINAVGNTLNRVKQEGGFKVHDPNAEPDPQDLKLAFKKLSKKFDILTYYQFIIGV